MAWAWRQWEADVVAGRILSPTMAPQSPRPDNFAPFRTADGRRWTHTRERGWVRSELVGEDPEPPTDREAHEEEPSVEARDPLQTLMDAGANALSSRERSETIRRLNDSLDEEARQIAEEARVAQGRRDLEMVQLRREYTEEWPTTAAGRLRLRNRIRQLLRETVDAHVLRQQREGFDIEFDPVWQAAHRAVCEWDGLPNSAVTRLSDMIHRWNDEQGSVGRAFYTDDANEESEQEGGEDEPPAAIRTYSESSSSQSEPEEGADVEIRMGRMARARRSLVFPANHPRRLLPQDQTRIRHQLRVLQERLDAEMANASDGVAFSEGAYLSMMNAVKAIWETVDSLFVV